MHIWPASDIQALPHTRRLDLFSPAHRLAGSLRFWCLIAAAWGSILAWRYRHYMNPDGISYLDIASEALRTGPLALVNRYWSPLYPAMITLWEGLLQPSPLAEFAYIHALNAVIYAAAAVSFAFFLRQLMQSRAGAGRGSMRDAIFIAFAFALFFHFMTADIAAFVVSPDLLVATTAFLSAGLFFRISRGLADWRPFLALGVTLAFGYLAKAAMLPAGIALLCLLLLCTPRSRPHRRGVWIAFGTACLLSIPQTLLVSKRVGHLSFSETGRLNVLWWVDGLEAYQGWTGTSGGATPIHGPRILQANPKIIEFAAPVHGTYPLWYDPGYWYAGAKSRIDLQREVVLLRNSFYLKIFPDLLVPLAGFIILWILAGRTRPERRELLFLLWPVAVVLMYAPIHTEYRYVAPFLAIFWVAAYSSILTQIRRAECILLTLLAALMLFPAIRHTVSSGRVFLDQHTTNPVIRSDWIRTSSDVWPDGIAARKLTAIALRPGDPIAIVGSGFLHFYAHIARVHIVVEVVNPPDFWSLQPNSAAAAERRLAATGAKILVARNRPEAFQPGLWQDIPGTPYSILDLRNRKPETQPRA